MGNRVNECPWQSIDGFRSPREVERFVEWLDRQALEGKAREVPVATHYAGSSVLREKWFEHVPSGATWRLVWPDPPFTGVFEEVR